MNDFKIVLPGKCNAKCAFCFGGSELPKISEHDWLYGFKHALINATPEYRQLNLTGGEPTMSPVYSEVLRVIRDIKIKFPKVVMTTNGFNLVPEVIAGAVDHLNISRHHYLEYTNAKIFGTPSVPSNDELASLIKRCNILGIDVSLSAVITKDFCIDTDVLKMISFCKEVGASALRIRKDFKLGLEPSLLEQMFNHIKPRNQGQCPVCRVKEQLIMGFPVYWLAGVLEPHDVIKDYVYEIIYQPTGDLTIDYAGKKPFNFVAPKRGFPTVGDFKPRVIDCTMLGGDCTLPPGDCAGGSGCGVHRPRTFDHGCYGHGGC